MPPCVNPITISLNRCKNTTRATNRTTTAVLGLESRRTPNMGRAVEITVREQARDAEHVRNRRAACMRPPSTHGPNARSCASTTTKSPTASAKNPESSSPASGAGGPELRFQARGVRTMSNNR